MTKKTKEASFKENLIETTSDILETKTAYNNSGTLMTGSLHIVKYFTGSTTPSSSVGDDGDIYLMS